MQSARLNQIISFVYLKIMPFTCNNFIEDAIVSSNYFQKVRNIMYDTHAIHHLHITGEIIGHAHGFCNKKVR